MHEEREKAEHGRELGAPALGEGLTRLGLSLPPIPIPLLRYLEQGCLGTKMGGHQPWTKKK